MPLALHDDDVDFAVWCTYKYLNGGPGSVGSIFVHARHSARRRRAAPDRLVGCGARTTGSTRTGRSWPTRGRRVEDVDLAALHDGAAAVSLAIFDEVGVPALRERSIRLTGFVETLLHDQGVEILTPADPAERGAQLSLRFPNAPAVLESSAVAASSPTTAPPTSSASPPTPLYNSFHELWRLGAILRDGRRGFGVGLAIVKVRSPRRHAGQPSSPGRSRRPVPLRRTRQVTTRLARRTTRFAVWPVWRARAAKYAARRRDTMRGVLAGASVHEARPSGRR